MSFVAKIRPFPAVLVTLATAFAAAQAVEPAAETVSAAEAVASYYRGDYRLAARQLQAAPGSAEGEGVRRYRIFFSLRAGDAAIEERNAARLRATVSLRADLERLKTPSAAHYLAALGAEPQARPERIHGWLDLEPRDLSRFEATKLLQLAAGAGVAPERTIPWVERLVEDPAYFAEPFSDDLLRTLPEIELSPDRRADLERRMLPAVRGHRDARLAWAGYLVATDRSEQAREWLDRLKAEEPEQEGWPASTRERWIEGLHGAGRPGDALPFAERLAGERGYARDWMRVGRIRRALGDEPGALRAYRRSLRANPTEILHRLEFARVLSGLGHLEEAERQYRRAGALASDMDDPFRSQAQLSLALFLENQDRFREALASARAIDPSSAQAARALRVQARAHWHLGEFEPVLRLTAQAIANGNGDAPIWHLRALAFRDRGVEGDKQRALAAMDEALSAAPGVRAYRVQRVELLWSADRGDEAIELQRVLLAEDGHDLPGWQRLGRMLVSNPVRLEDAAQAYREAIEYFPEDPELWQRLMQTLSLLREREQQTRS